MSKTLYKAESDVNYASKLFKSLLIPPGSARNVRHSRPLAGASGGLIKQLDPHRLLQELYWGLREHRGSSTSLHPKQLVKISWEMRVEMVFSPKSIGGQAMVEVLEISWGDGDFGTDLNRGGCGGT